MKQTLSKFKLFLSIEKEEAWLEEMSRKGWHLVKTPGLSYTFEKGEPEERTYRIDFRFFNKQSEMDEYLTLFEDSGWQAVNPNKSRSNFYFYTTRSDSPQEIFSDEASRAQRSYRFATYSFSTFVIIFLPYLVLYISGVISPENVGYLTPGLWQMQGAEFIQHFLFETPFVIMRVGFGYFPLIVLLIAGLFVLRSYLQYQKVKQKG